MEWPKKNFAHVSEGLESYEKKIVFFFIIWTNPKFQNCRRDLGQSLKHVSEPLESKTKKIGPPGGEGVGAGVLVVLFRDRAKRVEIICYLGGRYQVTSNFASWNFRFLDSLEGTKSKALKIKLWEMFTSLC